MHVCVGYIYSAGVSELVVGVCMGLAGATGILGTVLFTRLRRRLGLERTGLVAFTAQLSCLSLAVASVWSPGSPFDVHFDAAGPAAVSADHRVSCTNVTSGSSCSPLTDGAGTSPPPSHASVNVSIILLLVGIISSRIGNHYYNNTTSFVRPHRVCIAYKLCLKKIAHLFIFTITSSDVGRFA